MNSQYKNFQKFFTHHWSQFLHSIPQNLHAYVEHQSFGKALRPFFAYSLYQHLYKTEPPATYGRLLCVLEGIHTASLLHDDVVDMSPIRRGKPSLFSLHPSKSVIFMADAFLLYALDNIQEQPLWLRKIVQKTLRNLLMGQIDDTCMQQRHSLEYVRTCLKKTSSLWILAAVIGSVKDHGSYAQAHKRDLKKFGLLFQYANDMDDVFGHEWRHKAAHNTYQDSPITQWNKTHTHNPDHEDMLTAHITWPLWYLYERNFLSTKECDALFHLSKNHNQKMMLRALTQYRLIVSRGLWHDIQRTYERSDPFLQRWIQWLWKHCF